jgi:hypothetical protein
MTNNNIWVLHITDQITGATSRDYKVTRKVQYTDQTSRWRPSVWKDFKNLRNFKETFKQKVNYNVAW